MCIRDRPNCWLLAICHIATSVLGGTKSVSYTHLDVYKRQILYTYPVMVTAASVLLGRDRLTVVRLSLIHI